MNGVVIPVSRHQKGSRRLLAVSAGLTGIACISRCCYQAEPDRTPVPTSVGVGSKFGSAGDPHWPLEARLQHGRHVQPAGEGSGRISRWQPTSVRPAFPWMSAHNVHSSLWCALGLWAASLPVMNITRFDHICTVYITREEGCRTSETFAVWAVWYYPKADTVPRLAAPPSCTRCPHKC